MESLFFCRKCGFLMRFFLHLKGTTTPFHVRQQTTFSHRRLRAYFPRVLRAYKKTLELTAKAWTRVPSWAS